MNKYESLHERLPHVLNRFFASLNETFPNLRTEVEGSFDSSTNTYRHLAMQIYYALRLLDYPRVLASLSWEELQSVNEALGRSSVRSYFSAWQIVLGLEEKPLRYARCQMGGLAWWMKQIQTGDTPDYAIGEFIDTAYPTGLEPVEAERLRLALQAKRPQLEG